MRTLRIALFTIVFGLMALVVPTAAQAGTAPGSNSTPLSCSNGTYSAYYTVKWSNASGQRVSIDRVDITAAYKGSTRVNFIPLTGVEVKQGSTQIHWNLVPTGYNRPDAAFWWDQSFRVATSGNPIKVVIGATSPGTNNTCGGTYSFWG